MHSVTIIVIKYEIASVEKVPPKKLCIFKHRGKRKVCISKMLEIRQLKKEDRLAAIKLSDQTFRDHEHVSMGEAFPFIFSPHMITQSFGAFVDGELVSFMGLVPSVIRVGEAKLNVFSLGSVCTSPNHREKGIASQILEKIYEYIDSASGSLLLVSGDRSLYTRANCFHFGSMNRYKIHKPIENTNVGKIREMVPKDLFQMQQLVEEREVGYVQSISDLQTLLDAKAYASCYKFSHKTYVSMVDGRITSFIVLAIPNNKLQDSKSIAIEWAGSPEDIAQILSHALIEMDLQEIDIHVPWQELVLNDMLKEIPTKIEKKNQGTVYIVNPERLFAQLQPLIEKSNLSIEVSRVDQHLIAIETPTGTTKLEIKDFVAFVFDLHSTNPVVQNLQAESGNVFPIPFPYTAGLNYI